MWKILLIATLIIAGCQTMRPSGITEILPIGVVRGFDFREYTELGFLFTPGDYSGEYEAIGMITVTALPGAVKSMRVKSTYSLGGVVPPHYMELSWDVDELSPDDAIQAAYEKSIEMGADALINFNIESTTVYIEGAKLDGFDVSGFAIKRNQ